MYVMLCCYEIRVQSIHFGLQIPGTRLNWNVFVSDLRIRFNKRQNESVTYKMLRIRLESAKGSSSVKLANVTV